MGATKTLRHNDEAVSETLGYIIIFGIITACIAMVFIIGSQILADTQESTSFQSMEQSFEVIGSDLRRTAFEASPVMTTRVKVDYGTLVLLPSSQSGSMIVLKYNGHEYEVPLGKLSFHSTRWGKSICLENGALVKMYGGSSEFGTIMTLQPKMFYSPSTATLYVAVLDLQGTYSAMGGGVSSIQSRYLDSSITNDVSGTGPQTAMVCMRTNYTGAWRGYLTEDFDPKMTLDTTGDTGNWTNATLPGVSKLVIVRYDISVSI